jgi:NAD(P)-dependent dehydrogenase (short-subunit alcohol dehydrogenase family)
MFDLTGRVALVTGAGQHVGAGIAETLAECGTTVAVNDVIVARAAAEPARIVAGGGRAVSAPFDVTSIDEVRAGVAAVEAAAGPIDILVNNAGIPVDGARRTPAQFREMDPDSWHHYVDLNLYGVLNCVKAVLDGMCERGFGRIVTISSGAGQQGLGIGMSMYAAGKGGAISFMRDLAVEVGRFGVRCNTLALGLMENAAGQSLNLSAERTPSGRAGTGRDVGAAVVWLAAEGDWVTGQTIGINGGSLTH